VPHSSAPVRLFFVDPLLATDGLASCIATKISQATSHSSSLGSFLPTFASSTATKSVKQSAQSVPAQRRDFVCSKDRICWNRDVAIGGAIARKLKAQEPLLTSSGAQVGTRCRNAGEHDSNAHCGANNAGAELGVKARIEQAGVAQKKEEDLFDRSAESADKTASRQPEEATKARKASAPTTITSKRGSRRKR
jgi:hypothetical protein